jgi:hypothetical protein
VDGVFDFIWNLLLDLDGVWFVDWNLDLIWNLLLDFIWNLDLLVDWIWFWDLTDDKIEIMTKKGSVPTTTKIQPALTRCMVGRLEPSLHRAPS